MCKLQGAGCRGINDSSDIVVEGEEPAVVPWLFGDRGLSYTDYVLATEPFKSGGGTQCPGMCLCRVRAAVSGLLGLSVREKGQ